MMDEFKLMDQVKEELCYITIDIHKELSKSSKLIANRGQDVGLDPFGTKLKKSFVLPDFQSLNKGYVKKEDDEDVADEQVLLMEIERFSVPEVLFRPSDIGIDQAGIGEATWNSLKMLSLPEQALTAGNILLTGGNVNFAQFEERFYSEIRPNIPHMLNVKLYTPPFPEEYAWQGAARFVREERERGTLHNHMITKQQYYEYGNDYINEKYYNSW